MCRVIPDFKNPLDKETGVTRDLAKAGMRGGGGPLSAAKSL